MPSHPYVQYALLTALAALFYLNPAAGQALLSAIAILEVSHPTPITPR